MADSPRFDLTTWTRCLCPRRQLLFGAGGVVLAGALAGCGSSGSSSSGSTAAQRRRHPQAGRQLPARRHRRRLEGHHRRPDHRHQARPGSPGRRLGDAARVYDARLQARRPTAWPRRSTQDKPDAVDDPAARRHRVPQRQDAHAPTTSSTRSSASSNPKDGLFGGAGLGLDRPQADQEDGQPARCG